MRAASPPPRVGKKRFWDSPIFDLDAAAWTAASALGEPLVLLWVAVWAVAHFIYDLVRHGSPRRR